jgi:hypothetical protein
MKENLGLLEMLMINTLKNQRVNQAALLLV